MNVGDKVVIVNSPWWPFLWDGVRGELIEKHESGAWKIKPEDRNGYCFFFEDRLILASEIEEQK